MTQNLHKTIKDMLKWLVGNLMKILFSLTLAAIILYLGGIFHVYETIWIYAKNTIPTYS